MCGIFGYNQTSDETRNTSFFSDLAHRGPNATATHHTGSWTLGHLRLSIIETSSASNQPFLKDGNSLIFNGEIYNYLELTHDHLSQASLRTASDTEVLITLLNRDGLSCLNRLNGMFAFAWHDGKTDTLHLVRDRFGVKPLYYTSVGGHVFFSSEITPLARLQKNIQLDDGIIASFMADTATDFDERSGVVGIRQVRPGHYLQITADGSVAEVPWYHGQDSVIDTALFNDKEKTLAAFEDLLTDALRLRHRADVPICITLSGGLDSTTLYVLAKEKLQSKIQPFAFAHPGAATDESQRAIALARSYGDEAIVITSSPTHGPFALTEALRYLEFPIWNPSAVAYLDMYKAIKAHGYTVVIEGHGSDEQLGGYPYLIEAAWKQALLSLRFRFAHTLYRTWLGTQNTALGQLPPASSLVRDILMMGKGLLRGLVKTLLSPRKWKYLSFNALVRDSFDYKILPIVLRTFDRLPMAASLEARCPFMDYRVVEFIRALPLQYKVNEIGSKAILREVLKKYGHASIYQNRAKMGFASDVPTLINEEATRAALTSAVERFTHPMWHTEKAKAVTLLKKQHLTWDDVTPIWKVAAVTMTEDLYEQSR
jgi:asparagine synthase (glutamine-hydrolysing)